MYQQISLSTPSKENQARIPARPAQLSHTKNSHVARAGWGLRVVVIRPVCQPRMHIPQKKKPS